MNFKYIAQIISRDQTLSHDPNLTPCKAYTNHVDFKFNQVKY